MAEDAVREMPNPPPEDSLGETETTRHKRRALGKHWTRLRCARSGDAPVNGPASPNTGIVVRACEWGLRIAGSLGPKSSSAPDYRVAATAR